MICTTSSYCFYTTTSSAKPYSRTKTNSLNLLNLAQATEEQFALLVPACDTTPSGQIGDNSFPLKLDPSQFSMPFELSNTNILHKIQQDLVETDVTLRRMIRAELYKLDIYGKESLMFLIGLSLISNQRREPLSNHSKIYRAP